MNINLKKKANQVQSKYLDFLTDSVFQLLNTLFVLSYKNKHGRNMNVKKQMWFQSKKKLISKCQEITTYFIIANMW